MKKIIHKLKRNRLVSKIAALFTICMILVSLFTVSSFAADEEEATNSITDVLTGVTDSIISLLGSAQNVFLSSGPGDPLDVTVSDTPVDSIYYALSGFNLSLGDEYYFTVSIDTNGNNEVYQGLYRIVEFSDGSDSYASSYIEGNLPSDYRLLGSVFYFPEYGWVALYPGAVSQFPNSTVTVELNSVGGYQLSFLGVLAVVGVAIALAFLILAVISKFLRLRG